MSDQRQGKKPKNRLQTHHHADPSAPSQNQAVKKEPPSKPSIDVAPSLAIGATPNSVTGKPPQGRGANWVTAASTGLERATPKPRSEPSTATAEPQCTATSEGDRAVVSQFSTDESLVFSFASQTDHKKGRNSSRGGGSSSSSPPLHALAPHYDRTISTDRRALQHAIEDLYNSGSVTSSSLPPVARGAQVFPSGMCAISSVVTSLARFQADRLKPKQTSNSRSAPRSASSFTLLHGDELYCDSFRTLRLAQSLCSSGDVQCVLEQVNAADSKAVSEAFTRAQKEGRPVGLFFFEAASNPSARCFDFSIVPSLRLTSPTCLFVCDNTWLSGGLCNPLRLGADVVVESMTKYISGGRCIGGFSVCARSATESSGGPSAVEKAIESWITLNGLFVGADHCRLFLEGLHSLGPRLRALSERSCAVAHWLTDARIAGAVVDRVLHNSLVKRCTSSFSYPEKYASRFAAVMNGPFAKTELVEEEEGSAAQTLGLGVMIIHIKASKSAVQRALQREDLVFVPPAEQQQGRNGHQHRPDDSSIHLCTSFGGPTARICPWSVVSRPANAYDDEPFHRESAKAHGSTEEPATGVWLRFAVGHLDPVPKLLKDLEKFLCACTGSSP